MGDDGAAAVDEWRVAEPLILVVCVAGDLESTDTFDGACDDDDCDGCFQSQISSRLSIDALPDDVDVGDVRSIGIDVAAVVGFDDADDDAIGSVVAVSVAAAGATSAISSPVRST